MALCLLTISSKTLIQFIHGLGSLFHSCFKNMLNNLINGTRFILNYNQHGVIYNGRHRIGERLNRVAVYINCITS